jgi:Aspartyl/Asparaginyl beta-hydroxylase
MSSVPLPDFKYEPPKATWDQKLPAPCFYDWKEVYPYLEPLLGLTKEILDELIAYERRKPDGLFDWPEKNLWDPERGESWRVLPFVYTFPGNDPSKSAWVESAAKACPFTESLLRKIPGIRTALFSKMGPQTELTPHQGWADLSNHVLRIHLPLYVPALPQPEGSGRRLLSDEERQCCGLQVEGSAAAPGGVRYHKMGDFIVFDDSKMHMAFNRHPTESRYVLIFDLQRPEGLPLGDATGAMTGELEGLIEYFR